MTAGLLKMGPNRLSRKVCSELPLLAAQKSAVLSSWPCSLFRPCFWGLKDRTRLQAVFLLLFETRLITNVQYFMSDGTTRRATVSPSTEGKESRHVILQDCTRCTMWSSIRALPRRFLTLKCQVTSCYMYSLSAWMQFRLRPSEKCGIPCAEFHDTHERSTAQRADILYRLQQIHSVGMSTADRNSLRPSVKYVSRYADINETHACSMFGKEPLYQISW